MAINKVRIRNDVVIGGPAPVLITGPCVIESRAHCLRLAKRIGGLLRKSGLPGIFKASFDKANRTSIGSFRGPGIDEGLAILAEARERSGLPVTTDVHTVEQIERAAQVVDLLQIPAFLCRQTDLIVAAARSGCAVSIKKGQFLAPWDMEAVIDKFHQAGGRKLVLIERGSSFGYNTLVSDLRSLPIMRGFGVPVIFDGTHSVQAPGGKGGSSGGDRRFAPGLMRAALAMGCEGLFFETHDKPDEALSDGPNMLPLGRVGGFLAEVRALHAALGRPKPPA